MRLENYNQAKFKKNARLIFSKYLDMNKYSVFVFGSRANKALGREQSDIDIGIEGRRSVPFSKMALIRDEFENLPILYKVDVVDFKFVSKDFREFAKKNIEIL